MASAQTSTEIAALHAQANAGDAIAQYNLGVAYDNGQCVAVADGCVSVPQDYVEAVAWYRKAADQGDPDAQYNLGVMHDTGQGVPQDYVEAAAWYRKAADQGYANAQFNLGVSYAIGQGVPQDNVEAHKWHNLAAFRTSAENQTQYAEDRDRVANLMTPTQIADAQRLAREWQATFDARQE